MIVPTENQTSSLRTTFSSSSAWKHWITEPVQRRAECHRLREVRYVLVPLQQNGIFRSDQPARLPVDVDQPFARPVPSA